jgi:hypothetical protein
VWLAVFIGMPFLFGCQSESARWEFAQAQRLLEQGKDAEALEKMRDAVTQSGEDWQLTLPFAVELAKHGDRSSIGLCDRVLSQPVVAQTEALLQHAIETKVECQSYLGDFADALETHKRLYHQRVERTPLENNSLAYQRALAGSELELAYINIEQAIQAIASDWTCGERLKLEDKAIVASALLARYFFEEAGKPSSIESREAAHDRLRSTMTLLDRSISRIEDQYGTIIECENGDKDQVNLERCSARCNLVVLLIVRAMVHLDLQDNEASNRDRFRANSMARNLDKVIQNLPDERSCLSLLSTAAAAFLDTRGFIKTQLCRQEFGMKKPLFSDAEAVEDFDVAILASQIDRRAFQGRFGNSVNISVEQARSLEKHLTRQEAVLRYHRMTAHLRADNQQAAEADRQAIEKLGFKVNQQLF